MKKKTIRLIGVPMDLGQSRRGVDMGPSALRYAELAVRLRKLEYAAEDIGNLAVQVRDTMPRDRFRAPSSIQHAARIRMSSAAIRKRF